MNQIDQSITTLWDRYQLPEKKRIHVLYVARVCEYIGIKVNEESKKNCIDIQLLKSAALLHDIDIGIPFLPGEVHPDAAVRILRAEHLDTVADIVKKHSLYAILDRTIMPTTWEEKILYLSDKMVKYSVITVDKRFMLWRNDHLPNEALMKLERCYPLVKKLEKEIFSYIRVHPEDLSHIII